MPFGEYPPIIRVETPSDTATLVVASIVAVATMLLALFTALMARRTNDLATKTGEAVELAEREFTLGQSQLRAAQDQIEASNALVKEARADRELSAHPIVSVQLPGLDAPPEQTGTVDLMNVGNGAAVACRFIQRYNNEGRMTVATDLGPNAERRVPHSQIIDDASTRTLLYWTDASDTVRYAPAAIFARDLLGTKYQFLLAYTNDGKLVVDHIEKWSAGLMGGPDWATSALVWPNNYERWARRTVTHRTTGQRTTLVTETVPGDGTENGRPPEEIVSEYPETPKP